LYLEVGFDIHFTEWIIENLLCKPFHDLSNKEAKKALSWCDTLLPKQQLYQFKSNFILVVSSKGEKEQVKGDAIVNWFPYGNCL
jgi:hypothetical protein